MGFDLYSKLLNLEMFLRAQPMIFYSLPRKLLIFGLLFFAGVFLDIPFAWQNRIAFNFLVLCASVFLLASLLSAKEITSSQRTQHETFPATR